MTQKNIHKIGDLLYAHAGDGYVLGVITKIISNAEHNKFNIDWSNGLCSDVEYYEEDIESYKQLFEDKMSCQ